MDALDYWRLCDELTVTQAALLIAGRDPGPEECYVDNWQPHEQPEGYRAARHALITAVRNKKLPANVVYAVDRYSAAEAMPEMIDETESKHMLVASAKVVRDGKGVTLQATEVWPELYVLRREPDWNRTTIPRDSIIEWLARRGIRNSFFTPREAEADYLDTYDTRYAPKLAAAVRAWIAMQDPAVLNNGKSAKNALTKWLNEHAAEFGLCDEDGIPNKNGIDQCASVANWQPEGGAPKTPSR